MVIIGLTGWTGIAKYVRAELLRVRSLEYIEAAQSLGFSEWRIIFRHALPNSLTPVLITIAFGIASAILVESSLSFLGIGVQAELQTWGKLLSEAREDVSAWWLAVFPGLAIFVTVTIFNLIGEGLTDALDPRLKQ
jgi:peptide/nickel transport system permease protein